MGRAGFEYAHNTHRHVGDVTALRVAGGQTALPLNGEGHGRRHYMFHYNGKDLEATRLYDHKLVGQGLFSSKVYNVAREEHPMDDFKWLITPFQTLVSGHMATIQRFPHRQLPPAPTVPFAKFFQQD